MRNDTRTLKMCTQGNKLIATSELVKYYKLGWYLHLRPFAATRVVS